LEFLAVMQFELTPKAFTDFRFKLSPKAFTDFRLELTPKAFADFGFELTPKAFADFGFELTPKAFANFSPRFELARTLGTITSKCVLTLKGFATRLTLSGFGPSLGI